MSQAPLRLVSLHISPWSERARWVLDHHELEYELIEHVPFLGERRLRRIVGSRSARATVPVLLAPGETLTESWDIALYADRQGRGEPLVLPKLEQVKAYVELADRAMAAGRALVSAALLASPEALEETLPREVPRWARPLLRPVARHGAAWFARKYALDLTAMAEHTAVLRGTLERLRAALAQSSPYLLGSFSYADIVMASLLQGVSPVSGDHIRLGPATRRVWTRPELAHDFSDLVAWRDALYAKHRRAAKRASAAA